MILQRSNLLDNLNFMEDGMKKLLVCLAALVMLLSVCGMAMAQDTLVIYSARNERLNNIVIETFIAGGMNVSITSLFPLLKQLPASRLK